MYYNVILGKIFNFFESGFFIWKGKIKKIVFITKIFIAGNEVFPATNLPSKEVRNPGQNIF